MTRKFSSILAVFLLLTFVGAYRCSFAHAETADVEHYSLRMAVHNNAAILGIHHNTQGKIDISTFKKENANFVAFSLMDTREKPFKAFTYYFPGSTDNKGRPLNGVIDIVIHLFDDKNLPPAVTFKTVRAFSDDKQNRKVFINQVRIQWLNDNLESYRIEKIDLHSELYKFN